MERNAKDRAVLEGQVGKVGDGTVVCSHVQVWTGRTGEYGTGW